MFSAEITEKSNSLPSISIVKSRYYALSKDSKAFDKKKHFSATNSLIKLFDGSLQCKFIWTFLYTNTTIPLCFLNHIVSATFTLYG